VKSPKWYGKTQKAYIVERFSIRQASMKRRKEKISKTWWKQQKTKD